MRNNIYIRKIVLSCGMWLIMAHGVPAATLYLEDFATGLNGWGSRDSEMAVSDGGGYAAGNFGLSFLPQSDAFTISTGLNFIGDYTAANRTQIRFQLNAVHVLPSDLFVRISDGANTFSYPLTPLSVGNFDTYTVNMNWTYGWIGLSEAAFTTALTSVDSLEIQLTRNGSSAQSYYLDNVETLDTEIEDFVGLAIPEPTTVSLVLLTALVVIVFHRRPNRMLYGPYHENA